MDPTTSVQRPKRWDAPFGPEMSAADVARLLARPEFAAVEASKFPAHTPLSGILKNDARLMRYKPGDIIVREGDYGNSAFLILSGRARVVLAPGLPAYLLGRPKAKRKNLFQALAQLWRNRAIPEARDTPGALESKVRQGRGQEAPRVFLQDMPAVLSANKTVELREGSLFGELAALGRMPRTATVLAETEAELLEIRWQGLRELRRFDEGWRRQIDERYRANALKAHLNETPLFSSLSAPELQQVADATLFETYGSFDWHVSYKQLREMNEPELEREPLIAKEREYPDGLLMIRAGFARVSTALGHGERTLTYLKAGDVFGLWELYEAWKTGRGTALAASLRAVGYVDLLRVPSAVLERLVLPKIPAPAREFQRLAEQPLGDEALLEWGVEERFINGTKAMVIDLDRCTRCDDCVRACATSHGGNPRFLRQGKRLGHWMVANACMHCVDPVCLIGCPTGAIGRLEQGGIVQINDETCIGCKTCAQSCPYDNIVMVPIRDPKGKPWTDQASGQPLLKAAKCDLCADQPSGPACVNACPHDALQRVDFKTLLASRQKAL